MFVGLSKLHEIIFVVDATSLDKIIYETRNTRIRRLRNEEGVLRYGLIVEALLIETRFVNQELEFERAEVLKLFVEVRNAILTYTVTGVAELAVHIVARNEVERDHLKV